MGAGDYMALFDDIRNRPWFMGKAQLVCENVRSGVCSRRRLWYLRCAFDAPQWRAFAKAYLRTVFLWTPSSRAVALRESPLGLACCTFSQRVLWRAVGILYWCALDLRGLKSRSTSPVSNVARCESHGSPAPLMPRANAELY